MREIRPVWFESGRLTILDQTRLPNEEKYLVMESVEDVFDAIKKLKVRGAPAIGVAAAYGLVVAADRSSAGTLPELRRDIRKAAEYLNASRPTAVNLSWALKRQVGMLDRFEGTVEEAKEALLREADRIREEDETSNRRMGEYGLTLLKPGMGILTHCNAGILATSKYGTCLSPVYLGQEKGYDFHLFADETRPLLQGARLTSWELNRAGVDVTLITDSMANQVMKNGWIDAVVVGCDRMAANGDGANKIGTNSVAILAHEYGIPFYMFVPTSTIDMGCESGDDIEIELREPREVTDLWYAHPMAPDGVKVYNPAFDVTPAKYITAVVTEKGIARPPYQSSLKELLKQEKA